MNEPTQDKFNFEDLDQYKTTQEKEETLLTKLNDELRNAKRASWEAVRAWKEVDELEEMLYRVRGELK
jgi:hypothetical protein